MTRLRHANRVREFRAAAGMTQGELAEASRVEAPRSQVTVGVGRHRVERVAEVGLPPAAGLRAAVLAPAGVTLAEWTRESHRA